MAVESNWYEDFFHGVSLDLWRKAISPQQTKAEADFLFKALHCNAGSHLLDVPCGNGRLGLELAKRGYRVTGMDISEEFISEARASIMRVDQRNPPATAGGTDWLSRVEFLLGDMRDIEGEAIYDGAFCFGNSFGYLVYSDMEKFLNGVSRVLKPGARFVVETGMAAESVLPKFEEQTSHQIEDILLTTKEQYLAEESCIDTEYVFERNGETETRKAKHWIYTSAEIRRMLERAGLIVKDVFGSTNREPFKLGSGELLLVAQRDSS